MASAVEIAVQHFRLPVVCNHDELNTCCRLPYLQHIIESPIQDHLFTFLLPPDTWTFGHKGDGTRRVQTGHPPQLLLTGKLPSY